MSGDENQSRGICGPGPADGLEDLWEELKFCFLVEHLGDVLDWRSSGVDGPGGCSMCSKHMKRFVKNTQETGATVINAGGETKRREGRRLSLCKYGNWSRLLMCEMVIGVTITKGGEGGIKYLW